MNPSTKHPGKHETRDSDGFTLTEVLVVVVILTVLAVISVVVFSRQVAKAQSGIAQNTVAAASETLTRYQSETGRDGIRMETGRVWMSSDTGSTALPASTTSNVYVWVDSGVEDINHAPDGIAYNTPSWWCVEDEGGGEVWSATPDNPTPVNAPCDLTDPPPGAGGSGGGGGGRTPAALDTPTVVATSGSPDSIPVEWAAVSNADEYVVTTSPSATVGTVECVGGSCTTLIRDATNNIEYTVSVVASDSSGGRPDSAAGIGTATPNGDNPIIGTLISGLTLPQSVAVSPDGDHLYVAENGGGNPNNIKKYSLPGGDPQQVWSSTIGNPLGLVVSPDNTRLFIADRTNQYLREKNTTTGANLSGFRVIPAGTADPTNPAIHGNLMYVPHNASGGIYRNKVTVRNLTTNTIVATWTVPSRPMSVAVSPDGGTAYVSLQSPAVGDTEGRVLVVNTTTGAAVASWKVGDGFNPGVIGLSRNGDKLYVARSAGDSVKVLSTVTGTVTASWTPGISDVYGLAVSECSDRVYLTDRAGGVVKQVHQVSQC